MGGEERRQQRREVQDAEGHRRCESHDAAYRHRLCQGFVLCRFALGQNVRGASGELPSGVGQGEPPRRAVEQPGPQPGLDPADRLRDGRLRQIERAGRRREGTHFSDFREDREALEIGQLRHRS